MPRHIKRVTITAEGRDKGKTFIITELPADQAERWAIRAFLGMIQSGVEVSPETMAGGMASFAALGVQALGGITWEILDPLLTEMWTCVECQPPNAKVLPQPIAEGVNSQIEEVQTRLALRLSVLEIHMGFSLPGESLTSGQEKGESEESHTRTFRSLLGTWFQRVLRRS
jgi:hypothetical protein